MNFFNIIKHIQYFFVISIYKKQNRNKQSFNRVFETKTIFEFFFKMLFRIIFESEFDFKNITSNIQKINKFFKRKKRAYMINDDKKNINYYDFRNDEKSNSKTNYEKKNIESNAFEQNNHFVEIMKVVSGHPPFRCKKMQRVFQVQQQISSTHSRQI